MSLQNSVDNGIGLRDVGFVLAWVLALVLLVPAKLTSLIVMDETGLDALAPFAFMAIGPAVLLTLVPTLVAWRLYTRRTTGVTAVVAFGVFTAISAYLTPLFTLCGPNC